MRRLVIRNMSTTELGVMLEPWTDREDVEAGASLYVEGNFDDEDLTIDFGDENFLSIWCQPRCKLVKPEN